MNKYSVNISFENFRYSHQITEKPRADEFAEHFHNEYEMLLLVSGNIRFIVEDREYYLTKNDLVLVPPSVLHYVIPNEDTEYNRCVINFSGKGIDGKILKKVFSQFCVISVSDSIIPDTFLKLDMFSLYEPEMKKRLSLNTVYEILCIIGCESLPISGSSDTYKGEAIKTLIDYIDENLVSIKDIGEIADKLFFTKAYIHKLFRDTFGISPKKYIVEKRLLLAENRIRIGEAPTKVFLECGFADYSAFYRAYVSYFGYSPSKGKDRSENFFEV